MKKPILEIVTGTILLALGISVMLGWALRNAPMVQIVPGYVAMVFTTGFCFFLAGIAFLLPEGRRPRGHLVIGGLWISLTIIVLVENFAQIDLGVDLPAFHAWLSDPNMNPGRMAPNTALAFLLSGLALILNQHVRRQWQVVAVQLFSFAIILIGLTGIIGYALKLEYLYSWYHYTRMAVHTAGGVG